MEKNKRREHNWSTAEKDCLRELVNCHIGVIENKQNDLRMIRAKKHAWQTIREDMLASGFDRDVVRLKQQWVRMKTGAKKSISATRRAAATTGNAVAIPAIDEADLHIHSMLTCKMEEDTILIDSNTLMEPSLNLNSQSPAQLIPPPPWSLQQSDDVAACANNSKSVPASTANVTTRLHKLPKRSPTKVDVIKQRQQQIAKEISNMEELHLLRVAQLKAQIAHEAKMHKRAEEQSEEVHQLKIRKIELQIKKELKPNIK